MCWARGNIYGGDSTCDGLGVTYMGETINVQRG